MKNKRERLRKQILAIAFLAIFESGWAVNPQYGLPITIYQDLNGDSEAVTLIDGGSSSWGSILGGGGGLGYWGGGGDPPAADPDPVTYKKRKCEDGEDGDQKKGGGSFHWAVNAGTVRFNNTVDFQSLSRAGIQAGSLNRLPTTNFGELFDRVYGSSARGSFAIWIDVPEIDADVYSPDILNYTQGSSAEVLLDGTTLRQVLGDTAFTDVEELADGFRIRVWVRNGLSLTKSGGYYNLPAIEPVTDVKITNPDQPQNLGMLKLETTEKNGTYSRAWTTDIDQSDPDQIVIETKNAQGQIVRKEQIDYSNRGAKKWDYHLERKIWEAHTVDNAPVPITTGAQDELVRHSFEKYADYSQSAGGGEVGAARLMEHTEGYNGTSPRVTKLTYYTSGNPLLHGRVNTIERPDGSWEKFIYSDTQGGTLSTINRYTPWEDATLASYSNGRRARYTFTQGEATEEVSYKSKPLAKNKRTLVSADENEVIVEYSAYDGSNWHTTTRCNFSHAYHDTRISGRPKYVEHADGTAEIWTYGYDNQSRLQITHRSGAGSKLGITGGTEVIRTYSDNDVTIAVETNDIDSGLTLSRWDGSDLDARSRPETITWNANTADSESRKYFCCGLGETIDRNGVRTEYNRDDLKRTYEVITTHPGGGTSVTRQTDFKGLTTESRIKSGNETIETSRTIGKLNGLLWKTYSPDADNAVNPDTGLGMEETKYTYTTSAGGGRIVTVTRPDDGTIITEYFRDGRVKKVTGSAARPYVVDYATYSIFYRTVRIVTMLDAAGNPTPEWIWTAYDCLDRHVQDNYPGTLGRNRSLYHPLTAAAGSRGKLHQTIDPDGVTVTYSYDAQGRRDSMSEPMPNNAGDRVTTTEWEVVDDIELGKISRYTKSTVNNVKTGESWAAGDGYLSRSASFGVDSSSERTIPNTDGQWISTNVSGDGTLSVSYYDKARLVASTFWEANSTPPSTAPADITNVTTAGFVAGTSYTYDGFGRLLTQTDSRTDETNYDVRENGGDGDGWADQTDAGGLLAVEDSGDRRTEFTFDEMGRQLIVDREDTLDASNNTIGNITKTSYYPTGDTMARWGDQTYPVFYEYDPQGRMSEMRTWQDAAGNGITLTTGPAVSTGGYAATKWNYDDERGWLESKRYNDDKGPDYTYTGAGRLETRTWARGVVTTYGYEEGKMASVTYSNETNGHTTPDLSYTYDNFGRIDQVRRDGNLHADYTYSATDLTLTSEQLNIDIQSKTLHRYYDEEFRPLSLDLAGEHTIGYGYDASGRMNKVWHQPTLDATTKAPTGAADFTYGFEPNSYGLIETVTGPVHTVINTWETNRNILDKKENKKVTGGTLISKYDYSVNAIGQRESLTTSGSAFTTPPVWDWAYNARGELIEADDTSTADEDRAYEYDAIGNRVKTEEGLLGDLPTSANYTANALNQYTVADGVTLPTPAFDDDGNYTSGPLPTDTGNATLAWNAENRLVKITKSNNDMIEYDYDYIGRRIEKTVTPSGSSATTTYFVYDGWNLIGEYDGTALADSFTWGIDLSGSLQGAGGVGGLLAVTHEDQTGDSIFYPTFDGNGNVSEYVNASENVEEHFEYDPFGQLVVNSDSNGDFPIRFSSKYEDAESGLNYYAFRYYQPETGRWLNRDPIKERGGVNLYGFVKNSVPNFLDPFGQSPTKKGNGGKKGDSGSKTCPCSCVEFYFGERKPVFGRQGHDSNDKKNQILKKMPKGEAQKITKNKIGLIVGSRWKDPLPEECKDIKGKNFVVGVNIWGDSYPGKTVSKRISLGGELDVSIETPGGRQKSVPVFPIRP